MLHSRISVYQSNTKFPSYKFSRRFHLLHLEVDNLRCKIIVTAQLLVQVHTILIMTGRDVRRRGGEGVCWGMCCVGEGGEIRLTDRPSYPKMRADWTLQRWLERIYRFSFVNPENDLLNTRWSMLPDGHPYEGDCLARSERGILICATLQKNKQKTKK